MISIVWVTFVLLTFSCLKIVSSLSNVNIIRKISCKLLCILQYIIAKSLTTEKQAPKTHEFFLRQNGRIFANPPLFGQIWLPEILLLLLCNYFCLYFLLSAIRMLLVYQGCSIISWKNNKMLLETALLLQVVIIVAYFYVFLLNLIFVTIPITHSKFMFFFSSTFYRICLMSQIFFLDFFFLFYLNRI